MSDAVAAAPGGDRHAASAASGATSGSSSATTAARWPGVVIFALIVLVVVFGPLVHTTDPQYIDVRARNAWPSLAHPMGTDNIGRDVFAQLMQGGRVSLAVGVIAMADRAPRRHAGRGARRLLPAGSTAC